MLNAKAKTLGYPTIMHFIKSVHKGAVSGSDARALAGMVGCNPDMGCKRALEKHVIG